MHDNTPTMLLKELGNLKMDHKEKVNYFNQNFNHILNQFPLNMKPHKSITIDYYTYAFPTSIAQFVKRNVKQTFTKNYEEEIVVEKDLRTIGVFVYEEPKKDSKDMGKSS